jgi:hypothetical protein
MVTGQSRHWLFAEFCQLDEKSVFEAVDAKTLSRKQKGATL